MSRLPERAASTLRSRSSADQRPKGDDTGRDPGVIVEGVSDRRQRMHRSRPAEGKGARLSQAPPESKSVSAAVWTYLESIPGFNEDLRQAEEDLAAGRGVELKIRARPSRSSSHPQTRRTPA